MKTIKILCASLLFVISTSAIASGQYYIGATAGYYGLGKSDHWAGEVELGQMGLQAGRYFNDDVSVELGFSDNLNSDGFGILSLSALFWIGDDSSEYRPYFLLGHNNYNVDKTDDNQTDYNASQIMIGGGVGSNIGNNIQFRAELRYMVRKGVNEDDLGFQFSVNQYFD